MTFKNAGETIFDNFNPHFQLKSKVGKSKFSNNKFTKTEFE